MARPRSTSVDDLLALLSAGDPIMAGDLAAGLSISRPLLSKLVREAGSRVIRLGNARATAYVATDPATQGPWPLYRLTTDGRVVGLGLLNALRGDRFLFQAEGPHPNLLRAVEHLPGHFPGIPWFLDDVRPQGFLGRAMARRDGPALGAPSDLLSWRTPHNLAAILAGGNGMGDLLLGAQALTVALNEMDAPEDRVQINDRSSHYPAAAERAIAGEDIGSSPGGEQPKFTATVFSDSGRYAAIVKFAVIDRWADLLRMESLALEVLAEAGIAAAQAEFLQTSSHAFLEVRRFDRTPDVLGRRGFVSLSALDAAFVGAGRNDWSTAGQDLLGERLIDARTAERMGVIDWFGRFIGNTDMHQGNIGFHLVDDGPLSLCPVYDMLPMYLAPHSSGAQRALAPITLPAPPLPGQVQQFALAAKLAAQFWDRVSQAPLRGRSLADLAGVNRGVVTAYAERFSR